MTPNKIAAPNRRLRLGLAPWSFGFSKSQGSAVGELCRWPLDHSVTFTAFACQKLP